MWLSAVFGEMPVNAHFFMVGRAQAGTSISRAVDRRCAHRRHAMSVAENRGHHLAIEPP
jgi:hypothetical protein